MTTSALSEVTTQMRSVSVVSDCLRERENENFCKSEPTIFIACCYCINVDAHLALSPLLSLLMTKEEKLLSLSPMELNMTRPSGMPIMAYTMVKNLPPSVLGVE